MAKSFRDQPPSSDNNNTDVLTEESQQDTEQKPENQSQAEEKKPDDKTDEFVSWDDLQGVFDPDEENEQTQETETQAETTQATQDQATAIEDTKTVEDTKKETPREWWQTAAEKTGITASDEADYISKAKTQTRAKVKYVKTDTPELLELDEMLSLTPEERMTAVLKKNGYSDEAITGRLKYLKESGQFKFEDERIVNNLNTAIGNINTQITKRNKAAADKERLETEAFNKNIHNYLNETTEIFGVPLGKDEDSIKKFRAQIAKGVQRGGFARAVEKLTEEAINGNPKNFINAYFAVMHPDKIQVASKNKGDSQGKKEVLDEVYNNQSESRTYESVNDQNADKNKGERKGKTFR